MKTPLVFEGRNIYQAEQMESAGVEYYSIGRKNVLIDRPVAHIFENAELKGNTKKHGIG